MLFIAKEVAGSRNYLLTNKYSFPENKGKFIVVNVYDNVPYLLCAISMLLNLTN